MKPLVFLDIDGVLNRYHLILRVRKEGAGFLEPEQFVESEEGYDLVLDLRDAARLARLSQVADLVWGSTWEDKAWLVGRHLGLPTDMPYASRDKLREFVKGPGILRFAAGRPLVWLEDQETMADVAAFNDYAASHGVVAEIVHVDPRFGLRDRDIEAALEALSRS